MTKFTTQSALITGSNSGLGFETAAKLAEAGYGRIILAARTVAKAEAARIALVERTGRDPFETLGADVSSIAEANAAADELIARGEAIDQVLLNAGLVSGPQMRKTADGLEETFAASLVGHHILAVRLLDADLIREGSRVVLVGSEGANNDLPAMMDMPLYDFATGPSAEFGADLRESMVNFATGARPGSFHPFAQYAVTKLFSAWWSAAMARRYGDTVTFLTVSPGSNMSTNAGRNQTGIKKFMFTKLMPLVGAWFGMDMPIEAGVQRYIDALHNTGLDFQNGRTYTSRPKKMVGPLQAVEYPHLLDEERQELAWSVLVELSGAAPGREHLRAAS